MKSGVRVPDLWLDMSPWPKLPKCNLWAPYPKDKVFFEISKFYLVYRVILKKMRSCLLKLELGFWTYGLICLPGPNS